LSVVPMKLLTVAGPLDRFDEVAAACIVNQEIHLESALKLLQGVRGLRPMSLSDPYAAPLHRAEELMKRLEISPAQAPENTRDLQAIGTYFDDLDRRAAALRDAREEQLRLAEQDRNISTELSRLKGISADLGDLWNMTYARFRYGYLPRETYDSFQETLNQEEDVFFFPTNLEPKRVYGVYFTTKRAHPRVDTLMNSLHFVRIRIDNAPGGTVEDAVRQLEEKSRAAAQAAAGKTEELRALCSQEQEKLMGIYSYLRYAKECCDIRRYAACSHGTFYLTGWVPQDAAAGLMKKLRAEGDLSCVLDDGASVVAATPPTKLKNGPLGRAFRPFLEMYGLPSYHETDPSVFMALSYCLFFGIMFGDVGQGLGLALLGWLLWKKKGNWLGKIITCCGLSGAVFGCAYGSVFGFEDWLPGFKVLEGNHVLTILLLSVALGVVMLTAAMVVNIINGVRQRNYEKILFGPNGAAGAVFYIGLIAMAALTLTGRANLATPAYIVPVLVVPLVLILLKEPLSKLLAHDPTWKDIHPGELLGLGFFELFETLLSYLTNTLSFLRVGAYAIIHVGLMLVVRMLAGSGNIPVLVLGNLFVMGFEGFLVGIQVLRLEFYELFSRFYDDGGIPYQPHIVRYSVPAAR
jgi:V/A-type H+-transporting ATPase subunit I